MILLFLVVIFVHSQNYIRAINNQSFKASLKSNKNKITSLYLWISFVVTSYIYTYNNTYIIGSWAKVISLTEFHLI